jgi:hypothetical protein
MALPDQDVVLFKKALWRVAGAETAEKSITARKPGCSFQDPRPPSRPAKPPARNVLGPKLSCSFQDRASGASGPGPADARDSAPRIEDGSGGSSADSPDERRATSADCRGPLRRTRHRTGSWRDGSRPAAGAGNPPGCKRSDQAGTWMFGRIADSNGRIEAPIIFSRDCFKQRSLEKNRMFRVRYRNCYRVLTASPPMGTLLVLWLRPVPAEMALFFTGPNIRTSW